MEVRIGFGLEIFILVKYRDSFFLILYLIYYLDVYNGRANSVTPDYPKGIYAYYLPLNSSLMPVVPFLIGPNYYGTPKLQARPGIQTIPSTATTYFKYTGTTTSG